MTVRSADRDGGHGMGEGTKSPGRVQGAETPAADRGSLMRFARLVMRRKPVLILLVLTISLVLTVFYTWDLIRAGEVSGVVLIGANLCAIVIALVYLADDFLRR